jgi:hypothetical protein
VTFEDLRTLRGAVKLLWPGLGEDAYWPDTTLRFTAPRAADIDRLRAEQALAALYDEGPAWPPQLAVVLARARAIKPASYHQLAEPDAKRAPDADELARLERWRPQLQAAAEAHARRGRPLGRPLGEAIGRITRPEPKPAPQRLADLSAGQREVLVDMVRRGEPVPARYAHLVAEIEQPTTTEED